MAGLILLVLVGGGVAALLAQRHKGHPNAHNVPSVSPSTPLAGSTNQVPGTPPTTPSTTSRAIPLAARNIAGEATISAPPQAPNGKDAAGFPTNYAAVHLVDGDPSTAWRMVGDGTGYDVTFTFPGPRALYRVGLINGYAKSDPTSGEDRYRQGRRITAVRWLADGQELLRQSLRVDQRGMQVASLPVPTRAARTVTLHIDATTGFLKPFDYTAISEVVILGGSQSDQPE
jgi:hypothetical protein